jgi:cytochrome c-type biogenesis protein CcmH
VSNLLRRGPVLAALLTFASVTAAAQAAQSDSARPGAPAPRPAAVDSALERRVNQVSANLRCPVCQGLSILDSPSELAQDMKRLVREQLAAGKSQADIEQYFIARYGEWVLLKPSARGANLTVWLLPAVLILGGGLFLGFVVRRWIRQSSAPVDAAMAPKVAAPMGTPAELQARRDMLLRTLAELDDDFSDDKVTKEDYEALRRRDEAELVAVRQALKDAIAAEKKTGQPKKKAAAAAVPARRFHPALTWGAGIVVFGVVAALSLSGAVKPRGEGASITGFDPNEGEPPPETQQPAESSNDAARRTTLEARVAKDSNDYPALLELGHIYLKLQQLSPAAAVNMKAVKLRPRAKETGEAFAHLGMILWGANELEAGIQAIDQALSLSPDLPEALLYKGIILFAGANDPKGAVTAWERYLAVAPPDAETQRVRSMLEGARQAAASR